MYFALEKIEVLVHLSAMFLIGSFNGYLYNWHNVQIVEYYLIPWALYLISTGLFFLHMPEGKEYPDMPGRKDLAQLTLWSGALLMFVPPLFMSLVKSFPHAWIIFISAPIFVVLGIQQRVKSLLFMASLVIISESLLQIYEPISSLPKWVSLGGVGLGLISSAVVFEKNRNKVIELTKNAIQIVKEWN